MPMTPPKPTVATSEPMCFMVSWSARHGTTSPPLALMYIWMSFLFSLSRYSIVATSWLPSSSSTACRRAAHGSGKVPESRATRWCRGGPHGEHRVSHTTSGVCVRASGVTQYRRNLA